MFSINEINRYLGVVNWNGSHQKNLSFNKVTIDSRKYISNELFIALKGEKYDGHDFLQEVIEKGAKAVVISNENINLIPKNFPFWSVEDTLKAFNEIALLRRRKLNIPVIAITGSVGKTSTKEMTKEVLKKFGNVKASEKNNNNEIGVGLTIHSCDEKDDLLILEMGMRGLGQIEYLSRYCEPNIAVITNIGHSHIGILGSRENIAKAKCEVTKYLKPDGVVIIPHGDKLLDFKLKNFWNGRIIKVKLNYLEENIINNLEENIKNDFEENSIIGIYDKSLNLINVDNKKFQISLKGFHNALNFLFAYAISKELGFGFENKTEFNFSSIDGRNKIIKTNKLTIMDETYNASPESFKACIEVLIDFKGRHFIVLGSMKELGDYSLKHHIEIIKIIDDLDIVKGVFLCEKFLELKIRNSCTISNKIIFTNNKEDIIGIINKLTIKGDNLLIKGSRYWELEKIIPYLE